MRRLEKEDNRVYENMNSLIGESHLKMVYIHARS